MNSAAFQNSCICLADEIVVEDDAGEQRAGGQDDSGTSMTGGDSWTWCMTSWLARGSPWKVMKISRQE